MTTNIAKQLLLALLALLLCAPGCYTLSGVSIDPGTNTYYVAPFRNNALSAPPNLELNAAEALKEKIRTESRLVFSDVNPDIEFKGALVDFRVTAEAPSPGEVTALNRLTIVLSIDYINRKDEKKNWKNNFSFFYDYEGDTDLASIQDEAILSIFNQLMEDIFNKAFTDW